MPVEGGVPSPQLIDAVKSLTVPAVFASWKTRTCWPEIGVPSVAEMLAGVDTSDSGASLTVSEPVVVALDPATSATVSV